MSEDYSGNNNNIRYGYALISLHPNVITFLVYY